MSPTDYRRFGLDFTGTRPALKLGDPGIDEAWLRRHRCGVVGGALWYVLLPLLLVVGFMSAWGPFGWLDTWQLDTFGSNSVILLTILFLPLAFLPLIVAHLARIDASTPILLGIRQSFDTKWGPRIEDGRVDPRMRFRKLERAAKVVAAAGAITLAFFTWKGFHDAYSPHAPLPELTYDRLVDARVPLMPAVRVTGVVADRSREWVHDYSIRQDMHRDVYYALRPVGGRTGEPAALVELDQTSPQYDVASWNMVDAPGSREGIPEVPGEWTAAQLRRAGIALAPRVVVLKRQQLHGRDPWPDPLYDYLYGVFGFAAMFSGLLLWWSMRRADRQFSAQADYGKGHS